MDTAILGLPGFAFVVTVLATRAYVRHLDVLHGPYILGRPGGLLRRFWRPASSSIDRLFSLEGPKMIYFDSIGVG